MGQSGRKFGQNGQIVGQESDAARRIVLFLTRRHRLKTAEAVAAETGVPAATVRKWLQRLSAPSLPAFFLLCRAYGPVFFAEALGCVPPWLDEACCQEQRDQLDAALAALEAQAAALRPGRAGGEARP